MIARPLGKLRMQVNASSPVLPIFGAPWRPSLRSLEDHLQRLQETSDGSFFDDAGRQTLWMGIIPDGDGYATLQLPGAPCTVNSAQTYEAAAPSCGPWPDPGAAPGDWPILGEWSACGDHTRFSPPGTRRLPGRRASAQPVAPSPRIHEMDRKCAEAVSGIARRTSSSGPRNQHSEVMSAGRRMRGCGSG